ncbi:alpha/beta hydrolase [Microbulbifer taiwanensis]|uniref:Alpha/beta hydrolase n=1 Tax=Microbulbifer taiwanensis TaxID=986746 RepID=A0ABW1YP14_9GAMM|nr:hypothetical protein [Microbulbifer taiwanensis]
MLRWLVLAALVTAIPALAAEGGQSPKTYLSAQYPVEVQRDLVYGEGLVEASGAARLRALRMDYYHPGGSAAPAKRPALVLAFGGSWHRGGRNAQAMRDAEGNRNTPMSGYCRAFAARGYSCFSIDYRLTQEDPGLAGVADKKQLMDVALALKPEYTAHIDRVRAEMGLAPLTEKTRMHFWRSILGATEDMGLAVEHVRTNASKYGVDPERLAIGGWSAGAFTANNLGFGAGAPVKAVVSLSGGFWGYDLYRTLQGGDHPATLLVVGENDFPGILATAPPILQAFHRAAVDAELAWMPGRGHFYSMEDPSLAGDGSKKPLEQRLAEFLYRGLQLQELR